jgi:hypothetical protein
MEKFLHPAIWINSKVAETIRLWRDILKNNPGNPQDLEHPPWSISVVIATEEIFLPRVLVNIGLFESASQVKKNRPDLWRERIVPGGDHIEVGHIELFFLEYDDEARKLASDLDVASNDILRQEDGEAKFSLAEAEVKEHIKGIIRKREAENAKFQLPGTSSVNKI